MESELLVIQKTYELYKHFTECNSTITRSHRFGLGEKTLITTLDLLEQLIQAKHAGKSHKVHFLLVAAAKLEILRFQLRLYLDLKLVKETRVFQMQALVRDIGRQTGGWLKSVSR